MMESGELESFLASLDEITVDANALSSFELQKYKNENMRLKSLLKTVKDATREMLGLYENKRETAENLKQELSQVVKDSTELRRRYGELESEKVNEVFKLTQEMNEMKNKHDEELAAYVELSRDYLEVFSDVTCFHNYEVKKPQSRLINKTEAFLRKTFGSEYKKPKIIKSKRRSAGDSDLESVTSRTTSRASSRISKREATVLNDISFKRRKTDIWDMKSISQASSPAATIRFVDEETSDINSEICETDSRFSFNTFSIGNESSFSQRSYPAKSADEHKCKCQSFVESDTILVSIGVNTEPPEEVLPNVPSLLDIDEFEPVIDVPALSDAAPLSQISAERSQGNDAGTSSYIADLNMQVEILPIPTFASMATNTEPEVALQVKETVERGTSTQTVVMCNKETATVRSSTTRGTSTIAVATKSFGVQFPEVSVANILDEYSFDLPDCLSPIKELEILKQNMETMTDLCNVNREIDYVSVTAAKFKSQQEEPDSDETSFILLGHTLFDLFLKRIQKHNKPLSDDEITRQKIWKHLKRQLVDRFSELTFDEMLNSSCPDIQESSFTREEGKTLKEGHEELAMDIGNFEPKILSTFETTAILKPRETENVEMEQKVCSNLEMEIEEIEPIEDTECAIINECQITVTTPPIEAEQLKETAQQEEQIPEQIEKDSDSEVNDEECRKILEDLKEFLTSPSICVSPCQDVADVIWKSLFEEQSEEPTSIEYCPMTDRGVLDGYDLEHEPIEIPCDAEVEEIILNSMSRQFTEFETPKSPPPYIKSRSRKASLRNAKIIPTESMLKPKKVNLNVDSILEYNSKMRAEVLHWKQKQTPCGAQPEKQLCKTRKAIKTYLDSDWIDENLEVCLEAIGSSSEIVIVEAIYETIEDNKMQDEIITEFSPPAPPLPQYQQKLILLISKLTELNSNLPHKLVTNLEEKLFRLDNHTMSVEDLRNLCYYYSALVDLFFEGDATIVFYFIVKCIYFFGYKSIPMAFVLIKAFPAALPKKSTLMKKHKKDIDWENMTGLQLSKVQMDVNWMESLELTVTYLLTCTQQFNRKGHESYAIRDHEMFKFLPRFYGFQLSFITAPKLFEVLLQRLETGRTENLSLSFIILAKRADPEFTKKTMLKGKLLPLLTKYIGDMSDETSTELSSKICLLIEIISSVLKTFYDEKEKMFKEIFPLVVSVLGRAKDQRMQESCIAAILRLQRFIDNQMEVFKIIKHHHENSNMKMSDSLCYAIQTFIHRKDANFFKD